MTKMIATIAFILSAMISPLTSAESLDEQALTRADLVQAIASIESKKIEAMTDLTKEELSKKVANVSDEKLQEINLMILQNEEIADHGNDQVTAVLVFVTVLLLLGLA